MDQAEGSDDDYLVMSTTRLPTIITFEDKQVQTDRILKSSSNNQEPIKQEEESEPRDVQECLNIYRDDVSILGKRKLMSKFLVIYDASIAIGILNCSQF